MANENKPNTNHSQFFFTLDACEFLEKNHTIFGKVRGLELMEGRVCVAANLFFTKLGDWQHDFQFAECRRPGDGRERPTHESAQAAECRGAVEPVRGHRAAVRR